MTWQKFRYYISSPLVVLGAVSFTLTILIRGGSKGLRKANTKLEAFYASIQK